jgi:hypothetical protein
VYLGVALAVMTLLVVPSVFVSFTGDRLSEHHISHISRLLIANAGPQVLLLSPLPACVHASVLIAAPYSSLAVSLYPHPNADADP